MSAHATFGPSQADRWIRCLRSYYLHKQDGGGSSIYADEGTVGHFIGEQCLNNSSLQPKDFLDDTIGCNYHSSLTHLNHVILVDETLVDAAQEYIDHIRFITQSIKPENLIVKYEYRVKLTEDCWGTADCVIIDKGALCMWVIDLKMGKGVSVSAEDNYQLRTYGGAALRKIDPLATWFPRTVYLQIIQPRVPYEETLREEVLSSADLLTWIENFPLKAINLIKAAEDDPTRLALVAGEKQCRWCSFAATCKLHTSYILDQAGVEFTDYAIPKPMMRVADELNEDEISGILKALPLLDHWKKLVQEEALNRAQAGKRIPGFKVVESTKFRKFSDTDAVEKLLIGTIGEDKAYKKKLLSPAQSEKALAKKHDKYKELQSYIFKPTGSPSLAPMSSNKPEINVTAESEFKEFAAK